MSSPLVAGAVALYNNQKPTDSKELLIGNLINTSIQPANKNNISNPVIINLKNIKNLLLKKQYAKSLVTIKDLDTDGIYFKRSLEQLRIGERFYITINSIKKNG